MTPKMDLRIARRSVQQEVVDKLRDAILAGVFQPGDRLVEANLCASLGVSRPLLREALRSLQAERLIEVIPNRGPQIPVLSWSEAENIYDVRALLEGEAAALATAFIGEEQLTALDEALDAFRSAMVSDAPAERVRATADFYAIIFRSCGNKIIEEILGGLLARINFLRERSMSQAGRAINSYEEMHRILVAIRKRDAEEAREMARMHVFNARDSARSAFDATIQ